MRTVEFRDGERDIPDHLADMMTGFRTWEMTYEQARDMANTKFTRQRLIDAQNGLIKQHFRSNDGSPGR